MRLIDADALKEAFYNRKRTPDDTKYLRVPAELVYQFIDNAPTLGYEDGILSVETATRRAIELEDAYNNGWSDGFSDGKKEIPQGEWMHHYSVDIACECSNCHMQMPITDYFNFCPNCGAKMKGGVK